jgi:hypothetical protein
MYFDTTTSKFVEKKVSSSLFSAFTAFLFSPKREKKAQEVSLMTYPSFLIKDFTV